MLKTFDDVVAFNKANVDAFFQAGTKFATGAEEIAKEVFGYTGKAFEGAVETSKAFTSCKTPVEVAQLNQKLAKDNWDAAVAEGTKLAEMATVVTKSAFEPVQARYKAAFDSFSGK